MRLIRLLSTLLVVAGAGVTLASHADADAFWACQAIFTQEAVAGGVRQFQVGCSNAYQQDASVTYVGVPLTGTGAITDVQAARFLSLAQAAQLSGRKFWVRITNTNVCAGTPNCRYADNWALMN